MSHYEVLIIGGGSGGITVASQLANADNPPSMGIVEPNESHYYQPIWTLVGAGAVDRESSVRDEADFIPAGAEWLQTRAVSFEPDGNKVELEDGSSVTYDYLVVAAGIQLNWDAVKGLPEALGKDGVCSNYSYETVNSTWEAMRNFKGGNAVFTFPATPIKCAGAPQKIMWLAEHFFEKQGIRDESEVIFASATASIFGVDKYRTSLEKLVQERRIDTRFKQNLVEVDAANKRAIFEDTESGERQLIDYEMLHVTPPQGPPDFLASSPLANSDGWVDVHKYTLQHNRWDNIFSLGDCSSLPTSKTGAAVRKEAPVLVKNLLAHRAGEVMTEKYDGYASCPLVTGYGRLILAEFDYDGNPCETFPFDQSQERYSMYALKKHGLPNLYWNGMLRGRA
jgi:sulfide:quinone oxidoreductase